MSNLTHGALCNSIAGFAPAAQWAGIRTSWTSDTDPFCNAISRKHFPGARQYGDPPFFFSSSPTTKPAYSTPSHDPATRPRRPRSWQLPA